MIRTALFSSLVGCLFLMFSCKNEPKIAPSDAAGGQNPELARLNEWLAQDPSNDSLLYLRAEEYYNLDAYDEALQDLKTAIEYDSLQPQYYHLLADVLLDYARPNDSKRAIDVLLTAAYLFPDRIPTLLKLSEFQLIVKQHGKALATLDKILKQHPQHAEAFFMAGRVALDKGDTTNAIKSLQKSAQFDAENVGAWVFLGRIFSEKNNPIALKYYDNALRLDSTDLEIYEFKAAFYKRRGEFDKAFDVYCDIISRDHEYSNAYFDMGIIYLEQDSLDKAKQHFDIAIQTDPLFYRAIYYRGVVLEQQGKTDQAWENYDQAARMAPGFKEAEDAAKRLKKK